MHVLLCSQKVRMSTPCISAFGRKRLKVIKVHGQIAFEQRRLGTIQATLGVYSSTQQCQTSGFAVDELQALEHPLAFIGTEL